MKPPRPGRSYWICQLAGWGTFTAWVLSWYLAMVRPWHATDIASILFFNAAACPAISHQLRRRMYLREWAQRPLKQLVPRLAAATVAVAAALVCAVVLVAFVAIRVVLPTNAALSIFAGFAWAFAGWFIIYFAVQSRRRREALQLELAVVSRDAQLSTLRAQVNPHFLFNCLNSLRHLIVDNPDRALTMVTGLADLLRYSLASDRQELVPLAEELQIVDEYLELERVRLEERLTIERDVEPGVLTVRVPPMLVQTLVENAIKHGIATLRDGGVLRLTASRSGTAVDITVSNTGPLTTTESASGRGLLNARERLRLLYAGDASLSIEETDGVTRAAIRIPMRANA